MSLPGYSALRVNQYLHGMPGSSATVGVLAAAALLAFAEWEEWLSLVLGLCLVAAPWVLEFVVNENAVSHVGLDLFSAAVSARAVLN